MGGGLAGSSKQSYRAGTGVGGHRRATLAYILDDHAFLVDEPLQFLHPLGIIGVGQYHSSTLGKGFVKGLGKLPQALLPAPDPL